MKYFLFSLVIFSQAHASSYFCSRGEFLAHDIILNKVEQGWEMNSDSDCFFIEEEMASGEITLLSVNQSTSCFARNLSRPNTDRRIEKIILRKKLIETGRGYVKISLDNSFVEYGPRKLTSFIFCHTY